MPNSNIDCVDGKLRNIRRKLADICIELRDFRAQHPDVKADYVFDADNYTIHIKATITKEL